MAHLFSLFLVIFTFVELNCENLFDTEKDPVKDDAEYTEESLRHWNKRKYYEKLYNIGKEIISCASSPSSEGDGCMPDMVALCEVENDSVMVGLTRRTMLWSFHYDYVITHSPDRRGINTALMYNPDAFKLLDSKGIRVVLPDNKPTRDILYAKGVMANLDTLHVFVVHAPSRRGGENVTRKSRMAVAERLCEQMDSIRETNSVNQNSHGGFGNKHHILLAGDFNDYSGDAALTFIESNGMTEISKGAVGLYDKKCRGTYYFDGKWNSLDHIFASPDILTCFMGCHVNDNPVLLEPNDYGELVPKRSYKGYRYNRGFSDHLPLVARFKIDAK